MISFRVISEGFAMRDYGPLSPAIEFLAQRIAAKGGVFEVFDIPGGYVRLTVSAPLLGPTGWFECELAMEATSIEVHFIHRAIERMIAKAANRLMIR